MGIKYSYILEQAAVRELKPLVTNFISKTLSSSGKLEFNTFTILLLSIISLYILFPALIPVS